MSAAVACPYFFPQERTWSISWPFPQRLPLGAGFCGSCRSGENEVFPSNDELRDFCNLGYAEGCPFLPAQRVADAVRFAVANDSSECISLQYVFEREHHPVEHGRLDYDCVKQLWARPHPNACIQRQAECYLSVYLERRRKASGASTATQI